MNRKLANKFDGPYEIVKLFPKDRYLNTAVTGVKGYKRLKATVAVDYLRRYCSRLITDEVVSNGDE